MDNTSEFQLELAHPLIERSVRKPAHQRLASVVDKPIDGPKTFMGSSDEPVDLTGQSHIAGHGEQPIWVMTIECARCRVESIEIACTSRDSGTTRQQVVNERKTNARATAGHDDHPIGEF